MAPSHSGSVTSLRVAAISIAVYDALWTIPAEFYLYREQKSFRKLTRACVLFILIRYISVTTMVLSNVGFFNHGFTHKACQNFFLFSPIFKTLQTMISQVIVALRTVAVARHATWVLWTVGVLFVATVMLEFFSNIWHRVPFQMLESATKGNCSSGNVEGGKIAWVHYMAAMLYDATCLGIAIGYIWVQNGENPSHGLDTLSRMLLKEGIIYFCFLTASNILNLIFYVINTAESQTAGANFGYAFTWIMSQRLLIHLREYRRIRSNSSAQPKLAYEHKRGFPTFIQSRRGIYIEDGLELGVHDVVVEEASKDISDPHRISSSLTNAHRHSIARLYESHMQHKNGDENFYAWCNEGRKVDQIRSTP